MAEDRDSGAGPGFREPGDRDSGAGRAPGTGAEPRTGGEPRGGGDSLGVRFLLAANRLLPRPALPGEPDDSEYARWEYETSDVAVELWRTVGGAPVARALDLGCGLGGKTHRLAEETGSATRWVALDIAVDHLRKADRYHREVGLAGVAKTTGDAAALPFVDGAFDRIVTTDTLEHFPEPRRALAEMRRCLAPGGRVILIFNPWGSPRGSHLGDVLHLPWCQLWFSRDTLRTAARRAAERLADSAVDASIATAYRAQGESLVDHFDHHLHAVRIADLHRWIEEDGHFRVETRRGVGPGPLRGAGWVGEGPWREWLSASYGVVLAPRS